MSELILRILSDSEIETIHEKTLQILADQGVKITHQEILTELAKAGAGIDESTSQVTFPRDLVLELLETAPAVALETGLNGKVLHVGESNQYYLSLILDPVIVDYNQGLRKPVLEDVRRNTIIGESIDMIDALMRMQYPVQDIPAPDNYYKTMEVFLTHTTKHIAAYPTSTENCRDWMDVMEVIAGTAGLDAAETPLMSLAMAITSPLQVHDTNIEIMKMATKRSYPVIPTVCPMAGTSSPYSVAGTALLANVETLIPVLLTQVYKPGHPVFYSVGPSVTDMKSGNDLYYRVEKMIFKLIGCRMGRYYGLPVSGEAGGTLTYRADVQNGAESMLYLLASHTGKQNIIGGLGSLYNANGMSSEQIIMQCGLVDMAKYITRPLDFSESMLGVESIRRTGPGGNYLTDQLTLDVLHSNEFFSSQYLDLSGGYEKDVPGMFEKAHQIVEDLVGSYKPTVSQKIQDAIKGFFLRKYQDKSVADL